MLDKCANPACSATFLRLRDGKLFVAEVEVDDNGCVSKHRRQIEYFWLCNYCCRSMTIAVKKGKRAQVVLLPESVTATPAAS